MTVSSGQEVPLRSHASQSDYHPYAFRMNIIAIARNATMQAEESECFIIADDIHYSGFAMRGIVRTAGWGYRS
ncbi:UNVERIFIED_CONTAM: hypothetical protein DV094_11385 [Bifidobacterium longum subsp. infantis]|nr:hypothetical protein [Bifidobacterium longum subsp. infantis]